MYNDNVIENPKITPPVYEKKVPAGQRTYFFDLKRTKAGDYFLIITEKRDNTGNRELKGNVQDFIKSKVFIFKEDLDKFLVALQEAMNKVKELNGDLEQPNKIMNAEAAPDTDQE